MLGMADPCMATATPTPRTVSGVGQRRRPRFSFHPIASAPRSRQASRAQERTI